MNNVMTNGFCELNENEMMMVDGGVGNLPVVLAAFVNDKIKVSEQTCLFYIYGIWQRFNIFNDKGVSRICAKIPMRTSY